MLHATNRAASLVAEKIASVVAPSKAARHTDKECSQFQHGDTVDPANRERQDSDLRAYLERRSDDYDRAAELHQDRSSFAKNPWVVGREKYRFVKAECYCSALVRKSMTM